MSEHWKGVKKVTWTVGEMNLNLFLAKGWEVMRTEPCGNFTKYILGWKGEEVPVWPAGITNPLADWMKVIDTEIEKAQAALETGTKEE